MSEPASNGAIGPLEFRFGVECCRQSFGHEPDSSLRLPPAMDWAVFLRVAQFHRIEGLAWDCLALHWANLPEFVGAKLHAAASTIAADNLRAVQECRVLLNSFTRAKIPLLFLKGLPLGVLAYGNPAIKSSIDIDLLVDRDQLRPAAEILRNCGFRLIAPAESSDDHRLLRWHRGWKESVWRKRETGMQIDLHTRTADNPRLIPTIDVHSPRQHVELGDGILLPTLADEELFAYLAVHGASSAWFRLKWIADFAGFLSGKAAPTVAHFFGRSQSLGAGRAAGQALLLADALFGTLERDPHLRDEVARDPATLRLVRTALDLLTREPAEPTAKPWGTLPIRSTQLLLLPGLGYKFSEISRQGRQLFDRPSS